MRRLTLIATLFTLFAVLAFAQQDGVQVGPNMVRIEARHCQRYVRLYPQIVLGKSGFVVDGGSLAIDSIACAADPSALFYTETSHNIKTNAGVDFIAGQISGTASTATAQWIGLSTSSSTPLATDTTLPSEITANGLGRAQATYAHTVGATTYTLTELFTATGAQSGIWKAGVLTATYPGGTLVYEFLSGSAYSMNSGDQLSVQWTVTIS